MRNTTALAFPRYLLVVVVTVGPLSVSTVAGIAGAAQAPANVHLTPPSASKWQVPAHECGRTFKWIRHELTAEALRHASEDAERSKGRAGEGW